ncbi:MAG TPA: hypothetical protein VFC78_05350 [Tepidisphaeraceae bacterium]|nr:hypothetical protein [Tepidisphaeraceae bacterium]
MSETTVGLENLSYEDTRPLGPNHSLRGRAGENRRGSGRKLPWQQVMRALEASHPELLERADSIADSNDLKRSELLSRALEAVIAAMTQSAPSKRRHAPLLK